MKFTLGYSHTPTYWVVQYATHLCAIFMCDPPNDDMIHLNYYSNVMDIIL
jgi:hypothetical protein